MQGKVLATLHPLIVELVQDEPIFFYIVTITQIPYPRQEGAKKIMEFQKFG